MEEVKHDDTTMKKEKKPRSEAQVAAFQKGLVALKARRDAIKKEKEEKIKQISVPIELPQPVAAPPQVRPPVAAPLQERPPVAQSNPPPVAQQQGPVKKERKPYSPRVPKDQVTRSDFDNFKTDLYGIISSKQSQLNQEPFKSTAHRDAAEALVREGLYDRGQQQQQIIITEKLVSGSELLDKIFFH